MTTKQNQNSQTPPANNIANPEAIAGQRVPPQSLEAEMCTLGAMVLDPVCIGDIISIVNADYFYRLDHQMIFEALVKLYDQKRTADLVLLRDELKTRGQLDQVGGVEYLVSVAESVPSSANALFYANIVRDKALLRNLIRTSSEICNQAFEARGEVTEMLNEAEQKIFAVTEQKITGHASSMREVMEKVFEIIQDRDAGITGLATGFHELDELTSGLQNNEMIIVAARPSMGKTALGLNIAEYIGADNQKAVAVFSLEMAAQQLAERMLCGRGKVNSHHLRCGMIDAADYQKLQIAADELSSSPIFIDDSASLTPLELRAKARRLKHKHDIQAVVVDYLQLMHSPGAESRQQEVGLISRHIKAMARELQVPVIVMSQLNRAAEGREGHRPRMSDLRESGNIEQDADVVMLLHREDYYHNEADYEKTNVAEIIIAKQRNGPTGMVSLSWLAEMTRFENLSKVTEPFGY